MANLRQLTADSEEKEVKGVWSGKCGFMEREREGYRLNAIAKETNKKQNGKIVGFFEIARKFIALSKRNSSNNFKELLFRNTSKPRQ